MINSGGRMIKDIRRKAGLSQREFGKRIGKTGSYISQVESGKIQPSAEVMDTIRTLFPETTCNGSIAERLKLARRNREYTQEELAKAVSCNRNTISAAENGKSMPTTDLINRVCNFLWINESWLRFGVGSMERSEEIAEVLETIKSNPSVRSAVLMFLKTDAKSQDC